MKDRRHSYNVVSEEKITKMMEVHYQHRTEANIKWAVKLFKDWHEMQMSHGVCDLEIVNSNLENAHQIEKSDFEFALCRFICEVKKTREDGDFPGRTLYQIVCSLQNYLRKCEVNWKLIHRDNFTNFQRVLDSVMQERAAMLIGTVKKQAQVISLDYENSMWDKHILGEDSSVHNWSELHIKSRS